MFVSKILHDNTSTPKRRRLGTGRILRATIRGFDKEALSLRSPINSPASSVTKNDDPPLPCNQIEYLCDSGNNSSTSSDIPCSPGILEDSIMKNVDNWESLVVSRNLTSLMHKAVSECKKNNEFEDISDEMFHTKLKQEPSHNDQAESTLLTSSVAQHLRDNIEENFDVINQSLCDVTNVIKKSEKSSLFETKDSFLLDIKESFIVQEEIKKNHNVFHKPNIYNKISSEDSFYGLPIVTKSLFKMYRHIEKFYDWQEECLNLPAIKERRNLIYALPTSGGKTLVAEVLMMREVLNRKKNTLFILPFVAIVQEKMWSLSPFAVKLDFLIEEYAAGKGHVPPKKRRKKNSVYIATIEKGLALVRSLIQLGRLDEIGLIVVDELHLIGEQGRGGTLETLLTTVLFAKKNIQIVGMSATIGNLPDVARFLGADVFERDFRPVQLTEYVKLGDMLYRLSCGEILPDRQLAFDYSSLGDSLDPDRLGGLVWEVVPKGSCLVFCPTKRNCENVASLLCKLQRSEMVNHRTAEREALERALRKEGACADLVRNVRFGIAYHHAGLSSDERNLLEHAFRSGVISVLCCTSTLAAGVNLPARRVIVRAPLVGRDLITLGAYRQMAGRAGRAGHEHTGESILICGAREWPQIRSMLSAGLGPARSALSEPRALSALVLSAVGLGLATTRGKLKNFVDCTFMAVAPDENSPIDVKQACDFALQSLLQSGVLTLSKNGDTNTIATKNIHSASKYHAINNIDATNKTYSTSNSHAINNIDAISNNRATNNYECVVLDESELSVSKLGRAAIKACLELSVAKQLLLDLEKASRGLVLMGSLHLLYLVAPHDPPKPDYRHYYTLYCGLKEEGVRTANILGITEGNAIRMVTGKPITNVPERVLWRFYLAMLLHDLWNQTPVPTAADKYLLPRGTVQLILTSSTSMASSAQRFCEELDLWQFRALFAELAPRLQHCAAPELQHLMELPGVKKARALQLARAGYKRVEDLAKASVDDLLSSIDHLSRTNANLLISAARIILIEKVENLRAEAEDVMEELNI